eukprot:8713285-Heterocapsa_arctica.AAC.1
MDELERINVERSHARSHGIAWHPSQDSDFVKERRPKLPKMRYVNRNCGLITWSQYFSAAAGLPSGVPQIVKSQFSLRAPAISYKGPVPQAWTDYSLVLSGQWVHATREYPHVPKYWYSRDYQPQRSYPSEEDSRQAYHTPVENSGQAYLASAVCPGGVPASRVPLPIPSKAEARQAYFTSGDMDSEAWNEECLVYGAWTPVY